MQLCSPRISRVRDITIVTAGEKQRCSGGVKEKDILI